jgi:hypothetical protein
MAVVTGQITATPDESGYAVWAGTKETHRTRDIYISPEGRRPRVNDYVDDTANMFTNDRNEQKHYSELTKEDRVEPSKANLQWIAETNSSTYAGIPLAVRTTAKLQGKGTTSQGTIGRIKYDEYDAYHIPMINR